ncbi:MAG: hypothetical protein L6N96_00205 [Candidatus Methylarchaceae archaeon HK02M2]|nr:hypothetical protein [Candidatus Methylarchaceae archaeon HK02M2]
MFPQSDFWWLDKNEIVSKMKDAYWVLPKRDIDLYECYLRFSAQILKSILKRGNLNPKEAERQKRHRTEIVRFLEDEEELARHSKPKATARWAINLLASLRFKRYLKVTKGGREHTRIIS